MNKREKELKDFLEERVMRYNSPDFISSDPILIPHRFVRKEDQEISAFLAATIAWGQRKTIINNANKLMDLMDESPFDFICNHHPSDLKRFEKFVHRTFQYSDLLFFIQSLQDIYLNKGGLEKSFCENASSGFEAIERFRHVFLEFPHESRSEKHVSNPSKGSSAKRMNMFLRWMVRNDDCGVDLGIWKGIPCSVLSVPLDVHTGNVARKLGILKRSQNDRKAVEELDAVLRKLDPSDPVKYDYALFGLGVFESF